MVDTCAGLAGRAPTQLTGAPMQSTFLYFAAFTGMVTALIVEEQ